MGLHGNSVSMATGLRETTERLVKKKMEVQEQRTPWEDYLEKKKERRKQRRNQEVGPLICEHRGGIGRRGCLCCVFDVVIHTQQQRVSFPRGRRSPTSLMKMMKMTFRQTWTLTTPTSLRSWALQVPRQQQPIRLMSPSAGLKVIQ